MLRVFEFRETSQIAHILTPELGNITAIAKGVRQARPNPLIPSPLEPFSQIRVVIYHKSPTSMAIVKEATPLRIWSILRQDIKSFAVASLIFEIIDKSVQPEKEAGSIYELAKQFLTILEQSRISPLTICALYMLKLVTELGYEPQLYQCVYCQKRLNLHFFNAKKGGVVCTICAKQTEEPLILLDPGTLALMRKIFQTEYSRLQQLRLTTQQSITIINIALALYRAHLSSVPLKSWRFFTKTAFSELFRKQDESEQT